MATKDTPSKGPAKAEAEAPRAYLTLTKSELSAAIATLDHDPGKIADTRPWAAVVAQSAVTAKVYDAERKPTGEVLTGRAGLEHINATFGDGVHRNVPLDRAILARDVLDRLPKADQAKFDEVLAESAARRREATAARKRQPAAKAPAEKAEPAKTAAFDLKAIKQALVNLGAGTVHEVNMKGIMQDAAYVAEHRKDIRGDDLPAALATTVAAARGGRYAFPDQNALSIVAQAAAGLRKEGYDMAEAARLENRDAPAPDAGPYNIAMDYAIEARLAASKQADATGKGDAGKSPVTEGDKTEVFASKAEVDEARRALSGGAPAKTPMGVMLSTLAGSIEQPQWAKGADGKMHATGEAKSGKEALDALSAGFGKGAHRKVTFDAGKVADSLAAMSDEAYSAMAPALTAAVDASAARNADFRKRTAEAQAQPPKRAAGASR